MHTIENTRAKAASPAQRRSIIGRIDGATVAAPRVTCSEDPIGIAAAFRRRARPRRSYLAKLKNRPKFCQA
jgi:hypothetical protein